MGKNSYFSMVIGTSDIAVVSLFVYSDINCYYTEGVLCIPRVKSYHMAS